MDNESVRGTLCDLNSDARIFINYLKDLVKGKEIRTNLYWCKGSIYTNSATKVAFRFDKFINKNEGWGLESKYLETTPDKMIRALKDYIKTLNQKIDYIDKTSKQN